MRRMTTKSALSSSVVKQLPDHLVQFQCLVIFAPSIRLDFVAVPSRRQQAAGGGAKMRTSEVNDGADDDKEVTKTRWWLPAGSKEVEPPLLRYL